MPSPITRVAFTNFKGLKKLSLSLGSHNLLVGPNNAGKSTIISAFRILELGLRRARSRKPERFLIDGGEVITGYQIELGDLEISTENVHTDYADVESEITFTFSPDASLHLRFPRSGGCYMVAEASRAVVASPKSFDKLFPISLTVVPVLGPLERDEDFVKAKTVQKNLNTSRSSRNFRSYFAYYPEDFPVFASMVASTWAGMEVSPPEMEGDTVRMFCLEGRMTRELYWAGFGFQIWCQLVAYLSRAERNALIVIDEPEVYLHPDIQRQILPLLDQLSLNTLIASHSTEIISQAEPTEIIAVDKKQQTAKKLKDFDEVQLILNQLGSVQNLSLSRLARYQRVLFFEGQDLKLLRRLIDRGGEPLPDITLRTSVIQAGGFQAWKRIRDLLWGLRKLKLPLQICAVFDRDYFPDEEIKVLTDDLTSSGCVVHVHERKELENYLLDSQAIQNALSVAMNKRKIAVPTDIEAVVERLMQQAFDQQKEEVYTQRLTKSSALKVSSVDMATRLIQERACFETNWLNADWRLKVIGGKQAMVDIRKLLHEEFGISISDGAVAEKIRKEAVPADIVELGRVLTRFLSIEKGQSLAEGSESLL